MAGKILIVEGNFRFAEVLAANLNEAGYETSWAANLAQGVSKGITELPDLILTDLNLPDMIAVEAITILKHIPITSKIPIVVLTADTARRWKTRALKAGQRSISLNLSRLAIYFRLCVDSAVPPAASSRDVSMQTTMCI